MKVCARRFNIYLSVAMAVVLLAGCQTGKDSKDVSILRVHLQAPAASAGQPVSVLRASPVQINIARDPILTEINIAAARVVAAPEGFVIQIQFNEGGGWILEQYSAVNQGKRFVIFGQWGDKVGEGRWLAAPLINERLADGGLTFTADCSREEADRFVLGLNNAAKKYRKSMLQ
jgi:hypothetical protein